MRRASKVRRQEGGEDVRIGDESVEGHDRGIAAPGCLRPRMAGRPASNSLGSVPRLGLVGSARPQSASKTRKHLGTVAGAGGVARTLSPLGRAACPADGHRGACPSLTTPAAVVLAEAPTGACCSLGPPRGPWHRCAAAPVRPCARSAVARHFPARRVGPRVRLFRAHPSDREVTSAPIEEEIV